MDWLLTEISDSWSFWIVAGLLAMVGTTGALYAAYCGMRATERTDATVVELQKNNDSDGMPMFRPVVAFVADGVDHRVADPVARRPAGFHIGQQVKVYFRRDRPEQAQIGRWRALWPCLGLASAAWLAMGVAVWWQAR